MQCLYKTIKAGFLSLVMVLLAFPTLAATNSPVGYWETMLEGTNQPGSIVQISKNNGSLSGKVVKLYNNPDAVCSQCSGDLNNKPVRGMTILWGFNPLQNGNWSSGKILAVRRGMVFDADLTVAGDGQTMTVVVKTGMMGNRTQTWQRVSGPNG